MTYRALVAVLTIVHDPLFLDRSFACLIGQSDSRWQWCVAVSPSAPAGTFEHVKALIADEPRAIAVPGVSADPGALAGQLLGLARADTVAWLDAGDQLDPATFATVRERLQRAPWVYTDEAATDDEGTVVDVWFKPDYAPEWSRSQPYTLRLAVVPLDVVRDLGGVRTESGTAAWYDVVLRAAAVLGPPDHLAGPFYLHGVRGDGPPFIIGDPLDRCRVVARVLEADGAPVEVSPVAVAGRPVGQRVRRALHRHPRVSVIIPTRASWSRIHGFPRCHVVELVRSLWTEDRYPDLEVVVIYDVGTSPSALSEIQAITGGEVVLVPFDGPFHFSRKCNAGALAATGQYLCFLNDDMEVVTPDWLHELASLLQDPGVGAVGARLLFADDTLQHAGHEYNAGYAGHTMFRCGAQDLDSGGRALVTSERSGVTGACMLVRAADYLRVGGFSEEFPLSYNDVDLSLKIIAAGFRILYTPHATLFHYESQTRRATITDTEMRNIRWRWGPRLESDPYVNELLRSPTDTSSADLE